MKQRLKTIVRILLTITIFTSPFWVPTLTWHMTAPSTRQVVVVNYTVPYDNYHSHRGLMWALNYAKVPGPRPDQAWDQRVDYVGYRPDDRINPTRLSEIMLGAADLLYFADAYGVYEMDLEILEGTRIQPTRSPRIFGALSMADVDVVRRFVDSGRDVFVEFNSLPPPTGAEAREELEEILGVEWTGWVGRVFPDLYDITDVPDWFEGYFKERFPGQEMPREPSLVIFSYSGELIVISDNDYSQIAPRLRFTSVGRDRLGNVRAEAAYFKWFALCEPGPMTLTLGEIVLPDAIMRSDEYHTAELPLRFPVLTEYVVGPSHRYMMAFDGGNIPFDPGRYTMAYSHRVQQLLNRRKDVLSTRPAFWQFYVPVMNVILRE